MKAETPQINWHWRGEKTEPTPVFSLDFHHPPDGTDWRLATAGGDTTVRLWKVQRGTQTSITFVAELARHSASVNVVRFSPDGTYLASADNDGILLWQQGAAPQGNLVEGSEENLESWRCGKALRNHNQDVYDLAWSPDSKYLLSGSVDNTVTVFDVETGKVVQHITDHKNYVQGVAWSPTGRHIATQSCDRSCRVYSVARRAKAKKLTVSCIATNRKIKHKDSDATTTTDGPTDTTSAPAQAADAAPDTEAAAVAPKPRMHRLFVDEMKTTFFRRLTFSPDGKLLFAPAGMFVDEDGTEQHTMYIFRASDPTTPVMRLCAADSAVVAVRCSPILFRKRLASASDSPLFASLPYRMVFAVATAQSVFFYDTQQGVPFAMASNLHYASLADLSWSMDGRVLAVSSEDGYCSFITFEEDELGVSSDISPPLRPPPTDLFGETEPTTATKADKAPAGDSKSASEPVAEPPQQASAAMDTSKAKVPQAGKEKRRIAPTLVAPAPALKRPAEDGTAAETGTTKPAKRRIVPTVIVPSKEADGLRKMPMTATLGAAAQASLSPPKPAPGTKERRRITPTLVSKP